MNLKSKYTEELVADWILGVLKYYQKWVAEVAGKHLNADTAKLHWIMGLAGEAIELEMCKDEDHEKDEAGDVLFCAIATLNSIGYEINVNTATSILATAGEFTKRDILENAGRILENHKKDIFYTDRTRFEPVLYSDLVNIITKLISIYDLEEIISGNVAKLELRNAVRGTDYINTRVGLFVMEAHQ